MMVLIVEQNIHLNYILKTLIDSLGYDSLVCYDFNQALKVQKKLKPSIMIVDFDWMSSEEIELKLSFFLFLEEIIIITNLSKEMLTKLNVPSINLILQKPFDMDILVQHLTHYKENLNSERIL